MAPITVDKYVVLNGLYYTEEHEWVRIESNMKVRIGITDYAQKSLHEVVYVDLPKRGLTVSQKEQIATVESVKAVSDVYAPLSGEIIEVNEKLADSPELVNRSPYEDGWIAVIRPKALNDELKNLMSPTRYAEHLKKLLRSK